MMGGGLAIPGDWAGFSEGFFAFSFMGGGGRAVSVSTPLFREERPRNAISEPFSSASTSDLSRS